MGTSAELITAVRAAAAGTPYAVRETPKGFDLTIDVADAQWLAVFKAHGLKKVFTHKVALDEARQSMTITDVRTPSPGAVAAPRPGSRRRRPPSAAVSTRSRSARSSAST